MEPRSSAPRRRARARRGTSKGRTLKCPSCDRRLEPPVRADASDGMLVGHYECRCGWTGRKMLGPT